MRILVTGGAGFIGSSVCHVLLDAGHDVGVIDDLSTGKVENLHPAAWFRKLDILDPDLERAIGEFAPNAVVHLAAQSSVPVSIKDPERDWAVNAEGTRLVAEASTKAGAWRVVSASSAAVYGEPETVPLTECAATNPMNPYGCSKLAAEKLLACALEGAETDFASFRFANVYGPRQDAAGEGGVVALFLDAIARGREPVIFGDGEQTRDFIYVADVASAITRAVETRRQLRYAGGAEAVDDADARDAPQPVESSELAAYNISTGTETSVRQLADYVRGATRYTGSFAHGPAREGEIPRSALDPGRACRVLDWRAGVPLERGLAATWRWFASTA